ncbi:MAG: pilus assembly protein TadG-related protein [Actinomycetota bacterium]
MSRPDRGSVTIWVLGLSMLLLLFGGLALDYWRALALQRELAAVADSAAIAAASGIDEEHYRNTGEVILQPDRARDLAAAAVGWQGVHLIDLAVDVETTSVRVTVTGEVELGLLGVFVDQSEPLTVRGDASALPVLEP